jgi:hypothetical protein
VRDGRIGAIYCATAQGPDGGAIGAAEARARCRGARGFVALINSLYATGTGGANDSNDAGPALAAWRR